MTYLDLVLLRRDGEIVCVNGIVDRWTACKTDGIIDGKGGSWDGRARWKIDAVRRSCYGSIWPDDWGRKRI